MLARHLEEWAQDWCGQGLSLCGALCLALLAFPRPIQAQRLNTVGETEFRSRWSNYQADRPREEVAPELRPEAGQAPRGTSLRSFFQNGPVVLRAAVSAGWEYSDLELQTASTRNTSKSSLFAAPAFALLYDREIGPWSVSARYSGGYLYYFDQNFASSVNGGSVFSQTAGLDILRKGTRLVLRSSSVGSYGTGYEIDRGQQTRRLTLGETLSADYPLSEFVRIGALGNVVYASYTGETAASDSTQTGFSGKLFGDLFLTGKTGLHVELAAGGESQEAGAGTSASFERSYYQGLLGVNFQPTAKLIFRVGLGFGVLDQSGASVASTQDGLRAIYTLDAEYKPTEKVSARLHFGLEGTSVEPEFSLAVNWQPREATLVNLSVYQLVGLSTINFAQDQTRRGALASVQQRFFQRVVANLSAGVEQQEFTNSSASQSAQSGDPYSFFAAAVAWEVNEWLAWQVQYSWSSRSDNTVGAGDQPQNRASTSLRLTF